jgi:hypothetical protein
MKVAQHRKLSGLGLAFQSGPSRRDAMKVAHHFSGGSWSNRRARPGGTIEVFPSNVLLDKRFTGFLEATPSNFGKRLQGAKRHIDRPVRDDRLFGLLPSTSYWATFIGSLRDHSPNAQRPTPNAQRRTPNAKRQTPNALIRPKSDRSRPIRSWRSQGDPVPGHSVPIEPGNSLRSEPR